MAGIFHKVDYDELDHTVDWLEFLVPGETVASQTVTVRAPSPATIANEDNDETSSTFRLNVDGCVVDDRVRVDVDIVTSLGEKKRRTVTVQVID